MTRTVPIGIASVVAASSLFASLDAQQVELKIAPASQPMRYTIQTSSKVDTERQMLIDGEEPEFGGGRGRGFGGGGPVATKMKLVFDEGRDDSATWRTYHTAEASITSEGPEGEPADRKVEGGLVGKKLFLIEDDRGVVALEGSTKGEEIGGFMANGLPAAMEIDGLAPNKSITVDQEFELRKALRAAFKSFVHPIRPDAGAAGGGRRGGGEGRGGGQRGGGEGRGGGQRGGAEGRGGQRGGGQRGGFGGRGARGADDAALQLLANDKLDLAGTGKLISVETANGIELATVALSGKLTGEGTPTELGMSAFGGGRGGFGGGRGGRGGGGGGGGEDTGEAEAEVTFKGTMVIDVTNHRLHSLELTGKAHSKIDSVRMMRDREIESHTTTEGTFEIKVACEPAPAGEKKSD